MVIAFQEFSTGADACVDRAHLDADINCVIIPDSNPVQADGLLMSWNIYARQPGTVALDVRFNLPSCADF